MGTVISMREWKEAHQPAPVAPTPMQVYQAWWSFWTGVPSRDGSEK